MKLRRYPCRQLLHIVPVYAKGNIKTRLRVRSGKLIILRTAIWFVSCALHPKCFQKRGFSDVVLSNNDSKIPPYLELIAVNETLIISNSDCIYSHLILSLKANHHPHPLTQSSSPNVPPPQKYPYPPSRRGSLLADRCRAASGRAWLRRRGRARAPMPG